MIPEIEWEDGYPTEESVKAAEEYLDMWPTTSFEDGPRWIRETLLICAENCCASYREYHDEKNRFGEAVIKCYFSTGGWSGAEEIIGLIESDFCLSGFMEQWNRGGHYIFEFKK